mmetsp:Transcript_23770/g.75795  ORF Transcript_23770/g.75795 Transcript_23770/m.75795 type:complete len:239 (+) Transcript_23770:134-850(+)
MRSAASATLAGTTRGSPCSALAGSFRPPPAGSSTWSGTACRWTCPARSPGRRTRPRRAQAACRLCAPPPSAAASSTSRSSTPSSRARTPPCASTTLSLPRATKRRSGKTRPRSSGRTTTTALPSLPRTRPTPWAVAVKSRNCGTTSATASTPPRAALPSTSGRASRSRPSFAWMPCSLPAARAVLPSRSTRRTSWSPSCSPGPEQWFWSDGTRARVTQQFLSHVRPYAGTVPFFLFIS